MAIYAPTVDYSATANAISTKRNIIHAGISTESQKLKQGNLDIAGKQLDINDNNLNLQKAQLLVDSTIGAVKVGIGIWDAAKAKTEQAQFDTAKNSAIDQGLQFTELVTESILNGRTMVVQDADGQWDIQMDKSLTDWHSAQLKAINDSKDSNAVKAWRIQTLNQTYSSGQSQILAGVLKQTQATIGQQYDLGISKAAEVDIANGNYEMGTSLINSHSGFSAMQKEVQLGTYKKFIDNNVEKRNVSTLAATEGLGVATEYAYSLGAKGYSEDEIQKFVATASVTDKQLTTGLVESATSFMQSGLESGKTPRELYDQLDSKLESAPKERAQTAKDAAKDAHIAWATSKGYEMWNRDSESVDLGHLKSQRNSIINKNGEANLTIFAGLDKTQEVFASFYDKRIAAIEKENSTSNKNLTSLQIAENQQFMDATFENMKAGYISPSTAIDAVSGLSGNTPEEYKDDLYEMKLINKIKDNIVPDAYKPLATKFLSEMESLKFGIISKEDIKKGKSLTVEQTEQIAHARSFANESIASLFMDTAANTMSMDQFTKALGEIKQTFIGKSISALEEGKVVDKWRPFNDPTSLDDALAKNQQFGSLEASPVILSQSGQVQWAKPEMKATYDAIGDALVHQFKSQMGIDIVSERSPVKIDGKAYPTPIFQGKAPGWENSYYFAVDQGDIFASSDGKTWQYWNSFDTAPKVKETSPINEFFNQFRTQPTLTKKEKRIQDYQQKKAEKDPEGKHKYL